MPNSPQPNPVPLGRVQVVYYPSGKQSARIMKAPAAEFEYMPPPEIVKENESPLQPNGNGTRVRQIAALFEKNTANMTENSPRPPVSPRRSPRPSPRFHFPHQSQMGSMLLAETSLRVANISPKHNVSDSKLMYPKTPDVTPPRTVECFPEKLHISLETPSPEIVFPTRDAAFSLKPLCPEKETEAPEPHQPPVVASIRALNDSAVQPRFGIQRNSQVVEIEPVRPLRSCLKRSDSDEDEAKASTRGSLLRFSPVQSQTDLHDSSPSDAPPPSSRCSEARSSSVHSSRSSGDTSLSEDNSLDMRSSLREYAVYFAQFHQSPRRGQLESQHFRCVDCGQHLDRPPKFNLIEWWPFSESPDTHSSSGYPGYEPLYCSYSGKFFCRNCHSGECRPLPASIISLWDFTPQPISKSASRFLRIYFNEPIILYKQIHPVVKKSFPEVSFVHSMRRELVGLKDFFTSSGKSDAETATSRDSDSASEELVDLKPLSGTRSRKLFCGDSVSTERGPSQYQRKKGRKQTTAAACIKATNQFCAELVREVIPILPGDYWVSNVDCYSLADLMSIEAYRETLVSRSLSLSSLIPANLKHSKFFGGPVAAFFGCTAPPRTSRGNVPPLRLRLQEAAVSREATCILAAAAASSDPSELSERDENFVSQRRDTSSVNGVPSAKIFLAKLKDFVARWETHITQCAECHSAFEKFALRHPLSLSIIGA